MRQKGTVKSLSSDSDDDDEPLSKQKKPSNTEEDSSSESDIENYLQRPDKLDLDSPFFNLQKSTEIETGAQLSSTDSEHEEESPHTEVDPKIDEVSASKLNFNQLHEYRRKIEEARKHVEEYNKRRAVREKEMNIENLLAAGESKLNEEIKDFAGSLHSSDFESCSDSEQEGWEEVQEKEKETEKGKVEKPKEGLQITVEMPGAVKKKKGVDLLLAIKRRINRVRKENQVLIHKVHLLCWIAHGNYLNLKLNSHNVLGVALSLLPNDKCYPDNRTDLKYLEQLLKWYRKTVSNVDKPPVLSDKSLDELLESQISKNEVFDKKMLVFVFVAIMRSLGIQCRLVLSFQVEPLRPPSTELHSLSTKTDEKNIKNKEKGRTKARPGSSKESKSKVVDDRRESISDLELKIEAAASEKRNSSTSKAAKSVPEKNQYSEQIKINQPKMIKKMETSGPEENHSSRRNKSTTNEKPKMSSSKKEEKNSSKHKSSTNKSTSETKSRISSRLKNSSIQQSKSIKTEKSSPLIKIKLRDKVDNARRKSKKGSSVPQLDGANDTQLTSRPNLKRLKQKETPCPIKNHPKRLRTVRKYRDSSESEDNFATLTRKNSGKGANLKKLKNDVRSDIIDIMKKSIKEKQDLDRVKKVKKRKSAEDSEYGSDYVPEAVKKKHRKSEDEFTPKVKVKRRVQVKSDAEENKVKKKQGMDVWTEVFLEAEEKWISVDVVRGQVHCVNELYTRATHPISYIVAWDNNNNLKDITRRYCNNFYTVTRKLRIDTKWWENTLRPFTGVKTARDKEEDDQLERQQFEKPLPTSIAEYKNHPLYVLKRHLLKFEALYPLEAPTLGFVRNEPVYSRQCVYTLHSRDIWLKHAKIVKPGEQPYKIVKARPRWDKLSQKIVTDQMLEIFGPWQVEDYVPPAAENGIVPRNAFGNVELFKPCMLPKGTVHLKLPGLNKVAKRMNIDCAPALTGFDFHGGWNHPTYDGYIVCEEFADELVVAWEIEQDEIEKKEQEKIDKRVYGNWKRLIRGLLIRERLKTKYEFGETSGHNNKGKKKAKHLKITTKK